MLHKNKACRLQVVTPSPAVQLKAAAAAVTPDMSDMEGEAADPMCAEMEMNRIDFRNDISSLLDQIEKDFQAQAFGGVTPGIFDSLDTPPDSDSEAAVATSQKKAQLTSKQPDVQLLTMEQEDFKV